MQSLIYYIVYSYSFGTCDVTVTYYVITPSMGAIEYLPAPPQKRKRKKEYLPATTTLQGEDARHGYARIELQRRIQRKLGSDTPRLDSFAVSSPSRTYADCSWPAARTSLRCRRRRRRCACFLAAGKINFAHI